MSGWVMLIAPSYNPGRAARRNDTLGIPNKSTSRKLHFVSEGVRWHLPTACPVSLQQSRCLQPEALGSTGSRTQASSARIFSIEE
jgi:hypothetical protein